MQAASASQVAAGLLGEGAEHALRSGRSTLSSDRRSIASAIAGRSPTPFTMSIAEAAEQHRVARARDARARGSAAIRAPIE